MPKRIVHYEYLAQDRIWSLYEQIPRNRLPGLSVELGLNLQVLQVKSKPEPKELPLSAQAQAVLAHLEKHQPHDIGTVDEPRMYIKGTLPLFSYFLPMHYLLRRSPRPQFIYYGGATESTILGLAGPLRNLVGKSQASADSEEEPSSALPYLVRVLQEQYSSHRKYKSVEYDEGQALDCIEHMEKYNRSGQQLRTVSFLATVKLDSRNIDGRYEDKRALLASPVFLALAD